jgi:hypothetical protein
MFPLYRRLLLFARIDNRKIQLFLNRVRCKCKDVITDLPNLLVSCSAGYIPQKRYLDMIDRGSRLVIGYSVDSIQHIMNHLNAILRSKCIMNYS